MPAGRNDLEHLPAWPRGLSLEQAAAYVGVSAVHFRKHVKVTPLKVGGRVLYDRLALDRWLDSMQGGGSRSREDWLEELDGGDADARD